MSTLGAGSLGSGTLAGTLGAPALRIGVSRPAGTLFRTFTWVGGLVDGSTSFGPRSKQLRFSEVAAHGTVETPDSDLIWALRRHPDLFREE